MVVGLNHNIRYKDEVFHIQTEDSGLANPFITTLLFRGGTIISSKKTGYADILKIENIERVVEDLMKEQHKDMLRRLKAGDFDSRAFPSAASQPRPEAKSAAAPPSPPVSNTPPQTEKKVAPATKAECLDNVILDYLASDDE